MRTARDLVRALAGTVALLALMPPAAPAQSKPTGSIAGTITSSTGQPVADALVRLTRDTIAFTARTWDDGTYAVNGLDAGAYTVTVRRIGFSSAEEHVTVTDQRRTVNVQLAASTVALDTFRVRASWTGVTGVVADFFRMEPLRGALVHPLGSRDTVTTSDSGRFAIELPNGGTVALRVEEPGFVPRLVAVHVEKGKHVELAVLLDSARKRVVETHVYHDLEQRLRKASPRAGIITRAELLATNTNDLMIALRQSNSPGAKGLRVTRTACVFIDGLARPGIPPEAIKVREVEFIELYPAGADYSNTLASRWPPQADCGTADYRTQPGSPLDIQGTDLRLRGTDPGVAKFVLVWTRK